MNSAHTALEAFKIASQKVPAYQKFLHAHNIESPQIINEDDFLRLPITTKESYIKKYPLHELVRGGNMPPMAYASSGSTGTPTFWLGSDKHEERGGEIHEKIFRDVFGMSKEHSTLVIICLSMGVWVAGSYTLNSCRKVARRGWNITAITPGIEKEDIMHILRSFAQTFQNTILVGYPPFVMDIVTEAKKWNIPIGNNIKIITTGDKFTEEWRDDLLSYLKISNPYTALVSIYGCSDAAVLGYETPLSIFVRRKMREKANLFKEIAPENSAILPSVVQYEPKYIYFEEINGELVLTTDAPIPLVRYNIHDTGKVMTFYEIKFLLEKYALWEEAVNLGFSSWELPFLIQTGRSDVAVTFYALNIPGDHLKLCVEDRRVGSFLSGNFFAYTKDLSKSRRQKLYINVELKKDVRPSKDARQIVQKVIVENLLSLNIEYHKLRSSIGEKSLPVITLFPNGDVGLRKNERGLARLGGKKLRIISKDLYS